MDNIANHLHFRIASHYQLQYTDFMIYCTCRGINAKHIKQAFNELPYHAEQLKDDQTLYHFYARCTEIAEADGAVISSKPLEKRCPPCRQGFRDFVLDTLAAQRVMA